MPKFMYHQNMHWWQKEKRFDKNSFWLHDFADGDIECMALRHKF